MHMVNTSKLHGTLNSILLLSFGCLANSLCTLAFADTNTSPLQNILPQSCFIAGNFQQKKQLADIPQALESTGKFIFACDQGLIWHTQTPHQETLIYRRDGKHHLILPETEPERLKGRVHRELGNILNNLIGADIKYLNQHFDDTTVDNHHTLIPKNKRLRKFISSIGIEPDSEGTRILISQQHQESTDISIVQSKNFDTISADNCHDLFPLQTQACALLFQ